MGLGLMMGPVIASLLIRYLTYFWTLNVFALIVFTICMISICFIPKRLDLDQEEQKEVEDVPWASFMKNPRIISVLVLDFFAAMNLIFMDPILVLRLEDLGMNEDNTGLGFALMALTFTVGSGLFGALSQNFNKRVIICLAMLFTGVALWLAGGLKQASVAATWVGLGLNGLFVSGIFIPMIPELMGTTEAYIDEKKKD